MSMEHPDQLNMMQNQNINNSSYFGSGLILPDNGEDIGKVISQATIIDEEEELNLKDGIEKSEVYGNQMQ